MTNSAAARNHKASRRNPARGLRLWRFSVGRISASRLVWPRADGARLARLRQKPPISIIRRVGVCSRRCMAAQRIAPRMTPEDSVNEAVMFSVGLASTLYLGSPRMATAEAHATFGNWAHATRERPSSQARWDNGARLPAQAQARCCRQSDAGHFSTLLVLDLRDRKSVGYAII